MKKAIFRTKIYCDSENYTSQNGEVVEIVEEYKYRDEIRYTILFSNGAKVINIMSEELEFIEE